MKNIVRTKLTAAFAALLFSFIPLSASAFTGKELMEAFSRDERHMYIAGLVNMASYQAVLNGDDARSECIIDWFHEPDHIEATTLIQKAFLRYPDKHAEPIIVVLINGKCGKPNSELGGKPASK